MSWEDTKSNPITTDRGQFGMPKYPRTMSSPIPAAINPKPTNNLLREMFFILFILPDRRFNLAPRFKAADDWQCGKHGCNRQWSC